MILSDQNGLTPSYLVVWLLQLNPIEITNAYLYSYCNYVHQIEFKILTFHN